MANGRVIIYLFNHDKTRTYTCPMLVHVQSRIIISIEHFFLFFLQSFNQKISIRYMSLGCYILAQIRILVQQKKKKTKHILYFLPTKLACSSIQNYSQKIPKKTQGTPDDKSVFVALHSHAFPMSISFLAVKTCCQVTKEKRSYWDICNHNIMVY